VEELDWHRKKMQSQAVLHDTCAWALSPQRGFVSSPKSSGHGVPQNDLEVFIHSDGSQAGQPCGQDRQLQKYWAASLQQPAWRRLSTLESLR